MNSMEKLSCWSCSRGKAHSLKGIILRVIWWLELSERCGSQLLFCDRRIWILVSLGYNRWARLTEFIAFSVVSLWEMWPRTGQTLLPTRIVSQPRLRTMYQTRRRHRVLTLVGWGYVRERECAKILSEVLKENPRNWNRKNNWKTSKQFSNF